MIFKTFTLQRIILFLWDLLLVAMIVAPKRFFEYKVVLLVLILILIIFNKKAIDFNSPIIKFYFLITIYSSLAFFIGILRGNPGAYLFGRFYLGYFTIMTFIVIGIKNIPGVFNNTVNAIKIASAILCIYNTIYILIGFNLLPEYFLYNLEALPIKVWNHSGYVQYYTTNATMLVFLSPFFIGLGTDKRFDSRNRKINILLAFWSATILFFTGRRAFWLSLVITFVYFLVFKWRKNMLKRIKILFVVIMIFFIILSLGIFEISGITERFSSATNTQNFGTNVRVTQIVELFKGFLEYPLFGSGAGKGVAYTRSADGYSYEATYSLILYNSGLVGSLFYIFSHLLIIISLYKLTKKEEKYSSSILIGFISILVANGTNPYLTSTFDFIWMYFVPLLYLDTVRKQKQFERKV